MENFRPATFRSGLAISGALTIALCTLDDLSVIDQPGSSAWWTVIIREWLVILSRASRRRKLRRTMLAFLFAVALAVARIHASQVTMDAKIRDDSDLSQVKTAVSAVRIACSPIFEATVADIRHDYACPWTVTQERPCARELRLNERTYARVITECDPAEYFNAANARRDCAACFLASWNLTDCLSLRVLLCQRIARDHFDVLIFSLASFHAFSFTPHINFYILFRRTLIRYMLRTCRTREISARVAELNWRYHRRLIRCRWFF